jgi:sarcosine oxidase
METQRAEVIVVGLGAMGSAACLALARRGASVIGIDRFEPPHVYGSTHGGTRITRLAIGEGAEYIPLVRRSHELWRRLEAETGVSVLNQCGGLILARPASEFFERTCALAAEHGIAHERLANDELRARFPMFAVDELAEAYLEPTAGMLAPETGVAAELALAARQGAVLRVGEEVVDWSASAGGVVVTTDAGNRYRANRLVLAVGAWVPDLFPAGRPAFAVYRQLMHWFEIRQGYERLRDMPVFVWDFGGERSEFVHLSGFYGFPAVDGPDGGLKIGTELFEITVTPDGRQHPATAAETERLYGDYVDARLPWLGPSPVRTASCLYTSTRENHFVIDVHPEHDSVLLVSPCSGHGFKHSPAIGEGVAGWAMGDGLGPSDSGVDLSPFSLARSIG